MSVSRQPDLPAVGRGLPPPLLGRLERAGFLRVAHGGAPRVAPSNSDRAVAAAAALGVDLVEVDLHRSADGRLVLWHDRAISLADWPLIGFSRRSLSIASATLDELQSIELAGGARVIDLHQAIELVRGRSGLLLDLKARGLADQIVAVVRGAGFGSVVVCGDDVEALQRVRALAPEIGTSLTLSRRWARRFGADLLERLETDAVTVDWRAITPELVERCHASGVAVMAWTVDDIDQMRRLLALGVDSLTSNCPEDLVHLQR